MRVLCVAEKPSVAKSIAGILSGGQYQSRNTSVGWIKNMDFSYQLRPGAPYVDFTVTAVAGHLTSSDFTEQHRKWNSCDPFELFDAPIRIFTSTDNNMPGIERNLLNEARRADELMIWTDCDREGEHIGMEVANVCRRAKPNIKVTRARFSAIIAAQIHNAARNTVPLDMNQARAVEARMDLDLRTGAALTRMQTMKLQRAFPGTLENVISYGSCQFPTLGFVVERYNEVQNFVSEPFWYIHVALERDDFNVSFKWRRNHLFDHQAVLVLFEQCVLQPEATVVNVETKPASKWKPLPLTTVELQKNGSRLLRLPPKKVLEAAEALYHKGLVSYPRTETDQFDPKFNFHELIERQRQDGSWGQFASMLLDNGGYERPRNGRKNDKAHPPIHPVQHANNLQGDEKRVYEYITRRYLAMCSKNATGAKTEVDIVIAEEGFRASGLTVHQRNYLEVFPYDKWEGMHIPAFRVNERFVPSVCEMKEGRTTAPSLLTEADLVSLMDKNGIGTDATIAEHISKIIDREYAMRQKMNGKDYLVPSTLGIGLVEGYNRIGLDKSLSKPHLRAE
ncbi:prokaryotic type I DNA topoisomerase, partial [Cystobasidium minutum MCA 4210]|uniref:prokaryotic type I DNA topoisomerase n=1 Tax=Cystobasidium minutum MCA 4210 TaxID=1397322 RepID=UPI0034CFAB7D|eukprot:jgi/Rhomi1/161764/estExt_Genewise1Plus.C_5_t10234